LRGWLGGERVGSLGRMGLRERLAGEGAGGDQMVLGWVGMGSATEERRTWWVGGGRAAAFGDETGEQVGKVLLHSWLGGERAGRQFERGMDGR